MSTGVQAVVENSDTESSFAEAEIRFRRRGILFVVSAPSGAGKSTLLNALRPSSDFVYSVSCTTRTPRPGETHGADYHFIAREEFQSRIALGEFLEYAPVHGNYYGTLLNHVLQHLEKGSDVLLDIDVQGAAQIRGNPAVKDALCDVFLMPPSFHELRRRLLKRGTETAEQVEARLFTASREMEFWRDYRYTVISGSAEEDRQNFRAIMCAERALSVRLTPE